jgi:ectoine hydroxylase
MLHTNSELRRFEEDGYVFVPGLLTPAETDLLLNVARQDQEMLQHSFAVNDTSGRKSRLSLWNHPGDDVYGCVSRSRRIVDRMEAFLGGEVYHYHSKLMLKEPKVGGAWEWHQDYGYWYQNGCLYPYMASCLIALDRATRENGCLQVLRGSHHLGRIEHGRFGGQTGADPERVQAAMERLELVYCEMEPGTALFFHSNVLHASSANTSDKPRWSLICCYNAARNDPYKESHHPRYTPLSKVDDDEILKAGAGTAPRDFLDPDNDKTSEGERTRNVPTGV